MPGDARAQLRILALGHAGHRDDALLHAVEIDLHRDRRRGARRARLPAAGSASGGVRRRVRRAAAATAAAAAPRRRARGRRVSSSLSGSSGLGSPFFSTARYSPKFSLWSYDVMSSHCDFSPKSVDARNQRYLPLASHAGHIASARPSVTCFVSPVSTLLTKIA